MIEYVSLGISIVSVIACFIINGKLRNTREALQQEITLRKQQDDKLYYTLQSIKPQQEDKLQRIKKLQEEIKNLQQDHSSFDELISQR